MKKDFSNIDFKADANLEQEPPKKDAWETPEQIPVKPRFAVEDIEKLEHLNYAAGLPPYLRGPYSTMYAVRPWTNYHIQFRIIFLKINYMINQ